MVFGTRLDIVAEKLPEPVPPEEWLPVMSGFWFVLQHKPRAVMDRLPLLTIVPPLWAEVEVIFDADVVVTVGITTDAVVKLTWLPYAVPEAFVA